MPHLTPFDVPVDSQNIDSYNHVDMPCTMFKCRTPCLYALQVRTLQGTTDALRQMQGDRILHT